MSLSNAVKVHMLDPDVNNTSRSVFHLPVGMLSSDIQLTDLGVYSAQGANRELYYPSRSGVLGSIKSITLYSNGTILDEIQEVRSWASVQHLLTSNCRAQDLNKFELLNGSDAEYDYAKSKYSFQGRLKDYADTFALAADSAAVGASTVHHNQLAIPTAETGTSAVVSLKRYMGLLDSTDVLPNIPKMTVVITWNLTAANFVNDANATGGAAANPSFSNFRPTLIVKELLNVPQQYDAQIPFYSVMTDSYAIPPVAAGTTQSETLRTGNYRQRMLRDIVLFNKPSTDINQYKDFETSLAQNAEKIQLVVNGSNWLPYDGIDTPAIKMRMFTDTMGSLNTNIVSYLPKLTDAGAIFADDDVPNNPSSQVNSTFSVAGIKIGTVIERLDIIYQRTGSNNADLPANDQTLGFTLLAFGRIAKMLRLKGGQLQISY